jgi:hypothetical protein
MNDFTQGEQRVMNKIRNFALLTLAILTFSVSGVNAQNYSSNSSTRTVEQKIFKEINKLPYYGVFDHIAFSYNGGTVTLYGKVANAMNKRGAERSIRDVAGVTNVVNRMKFYRSAALITRFAVRLWVNLRAEACIVICGNRILRSESSLTADTSRSKVMLPIAATLI